MPDPEPILPKRTHRKFRNIDRLAGDANFPSRFRLAGVLGTEED
jgi:hypothetical protein